MSCYSVDWIPGARARLANLWNENPRVRQEISDASQEIDEALESDPWAVGRAFSPQHRVIVRIPLSVLYRIFEDDLRVDVLAVKFWDE